MVAEKTNNRCSNVNMTVTEQLVKDYVASGLRKLGYDNPWRSDYPSSQPTPVMRTLRQIGGRFEEEYNNNFENMMDTFDIFSPDAEDNFKNVASFLFQTGIGWGRITGLIVFATKLSIAATESNRMDLVQSIVQWTCSILETPAMSNWISQNDGWNGFIKYYEKQENGLTWGTVFSIGIGTAAAVAAVVNFFKN